MNKILSAKGRENVRYIVTRSTDTSGAVRIDEAVAVFIDGLQLLIKAGNCSEKWLKRAVSAVVKLCAEGYDIHMCIHTDALSADTIRRAVNKPELAGTSVVTSEEALEAALRYSRFVLTVPHCDEGGFYTLGQGDKRLMIACEGTELAETLAAAAGTERNGAQQ